MPFSLLMLVIKTTIPCNKELEHKVSSIRHLGLLASKYK